MAVLDGRSATRYAPPAMAIAEEMRAAVGCLTAAGPPRSASRAALAAGLAFYPATGLALGALAAAIAMVVETVAPRAAGPAGVLVLVLLAGGRGARGLAAAAAILRSGTPAARLAHLRARPGAGGTALALATLAVRAAAAAVLPSPARTTALLVAPMLGAWAVVVQCYGGTPEHARGPAAALVGRARFREFAWASVIALGLTLAVGEPIGLLLVLVASLTTVSIRVVAHRRVGGLTGRLLAATRELVETAVFVLLALLVEVGR